jgi:hypothetical protein
VGLFVLVPTDDDTALDPRSRGPRGTAALREVLTELGASVQVTAEVPGDVADVTVWLPADRLSDPTRAQLDAWVRRGGRLVLTDPASPLNPAPALGQLVTDTFGAVGRSPDCDLLDGFVTEVESSRWVQLDADEARVTCFGDGAQAASLVVVDVGDGEVVVTGAVDALTNAALGKASNGRFGVALLAPSGTGDVEVLWDASLGGGDTPLLSLLPDGLILGAWVAAAAVVVFAWSRARRVGAPVTERVPVRVPGSELVLAIGELLERHGHRDAAAVRLRDDLRGDVAVALSLPRDTPADVLAEVVVDRVAPDLDPAAVAGILTDGPVADDDAFAALAAASARLRRRLRSVTG